jgi:hypothetical protein
LTLLTEKFERMLTLAGVNDVAALTRRRVRTRENWREMA